MSLERMQSFKRALRVNRGVGNSIAGMVCINRRKIDSFMKRNSAIIKRVSFVRNHLELRHNNSFKHVQGFRYSGICDGLICSMSTEVDGEEKGEHDKEEQEDEEVISENEEGDEVVIG